MGLECSVCRNSGELGRSKVLDNVWPVCECTGHLQIFLWIKYRAQVLEPRAVVVEVACAEYVSYLACWPIGEPCENYGGGQKPAELPTST